MAPRHLRSGQPWLVAAKLRSDEFRTPRLDRGPFQGLRQGERAGALPYAFKESTWKQLAAGIRFVQGAFDVQKAFRRLSDTVAELDRDRGTRGNHAFYMSVPPRAFPQVSRQLADCGLAATRALGVVIIEKPFGHDLASAKELDQRGLRSVRPVERVPHRPLSWQETVQNMLALRFANAMYEPITRNNNYVDHVQVAMAEDIWRGRSAPDTTTASAPARHLSRPSCCSLWR